VGKFNNVLNKFNIKNQDKINLTPKIIKPTEKKSITTKFKGIIRNIIKVPIYTIKTVKDITYIANDSINDLISIKSSSSSSSSIDIISQTKENILNNIDQTKETIENVSEAIIELPQNVINDVSINVNNTIVTISNTVNTINNLPNNVIKTSKQIKLTVKKIIKLPGKALKSIKNIINNIYDITDKINGIDTNSEIKGKGKLIYSLVENNDDNKSINTIVDEIKESLYTTADTITGTINIVQDTIPKIINTIEDIPEIPNKVVTTYKTTEENFNNKVTEIQVNFDNTKENIIKFSNILYKIISLQAAKETIVTINTKYNNVIDTIDQTKATVNNAKEFIVNINKPKPIQSKEISKIEKITKTITNVGSTVNNLGETVKVTGAVAVAFGSIGVTIFQGYYNYYIYI